MHELSILLGLSGSEQSKYAAELAWSLAKRCGGKVCAQHVVDTRTAWDFLRNDRSGFTGSGVYVGAYENLCKSLKEIGTALTEKFTAVANGQNVPTEVLVEEGSPVRRMCARAISHDLVVIGHQPRDPSVKEREHCQFVRYAVAEGLAHDCPRPLLVVQAKLEGWTSMSILASADHLNFKFISACLKFAAALDLKPVLIVFTSGTREQPREAILKDIREAHPDFAELEINFSELRGVSVDKKSLFQGELEVDWQPDPDTLLVLPTRATGGHRITIFGTSPDLFVRNLPLPAILMWPEEHVEIDFKINLKQAVHSG